MLQMKIQVLLGLKFSLENLCFFSLGFVKDKPVVKMWDPEKKRENLFKLNFNPSRASINKNVKWLFGRISSHNYPWLFMSLEQTLMECGESRGNGRCHWKDSFLDNRYYKW